jgi:hypothetical protein
MDEYLRYKSTFAILLGLLCRLTVVVISGVRLSPRTRVLRVLCLLIGFCLLQYIFVELEWAQQKVSAPIDSRTEYQVNSLSR